MLVIVAINILHLQYTNLAPWRSDHRNCHAGIFCSLQTFRSSDIFVYTSSVSILLQKTDYMTPGLTAVQAKSLNDDMNADRFWLSYPLWAHLIKEHSTLT